MNDLRAKIIRLAASYPAGSAGRRGLLAVLREAAETRGPGGLNFSLRGQSFSVRTTPSDPPYNQTYDAMILVDRGAKAVYRAALDVLHANWADIAKMKTLSDVQSFVDAKVFEQHRKYPNWHSYSMPD